MNNIGVCNFNVALMRDLMNGAKIYPSVLQLEFHPYFSQKKLIQFCRSNRVQLTAYSSFNSK